MASASSNRSCLHLVARSSGDALARCARVCGAQDRLLFVDDGVMLLADPRNQPLSPLLLDGLYLAADIDARGLSAIATRLGVGAVTDDEFVQLLRDHDSCLTWK